MNLWACCRINTSHFVWPINIVQNMLCLHQITYSLYYDCASVGYYYCIMCIEEYYNCLITLSVYSIQYIYTECIICMK